MVPSAHAQALHDQLIAAGATPGGPETVVALRAASGLPVYTPDAERPSGLDLLRAAAPSRFELRKPYFVGQHVFAEARHQAELPLFQYPKLSNTLPAHSQPPNLSAPQRTPLYEWHKAHTRHIVPFAGWEMPVWYTGVLDEHRTVRRAAGLFDVAHMGVFEVSGPHAIEFLDLVCTNYVRWYAPGESFYSYLLDPDGNVIDDLLVYRRETNRFQIVVNASNADKDWAWLNAVNNGEVLLDRNRPDLRVLRPATIRNLKDPSAGADRRVDLALQGPASLRILQSLTADRRLADRLGRVRKTGLIECELAGFDLIIARTGYTGEDIAYEIFVHPDRTVAFWETLLEAGQAVRPPTGRAGRARLHPHRSRSAALRPRAGRAVRHLARGRRLRGLCQAAQAVLHRPQRANGAGESAGHAGRPLPHERARCADAEDGDPVVNKKGQAIGWVTSAAVDVDGVILGLAYIQSRYARPGDEIGIFNVPTGKPVVEREQQGRPEAGRQSQPARRGHAAAALPGQSRACALARASKLPAGGSPASTRRRTEWMADDRNR